MRRARALWVAVSLLVGVTLQTAQAAPLRTTQLRAQSCCAGKCRRMVSLGRAMQCCAVPQDTGATLTPSAAPRAPQPVVAVVGPAPAIVVVAPQRVQRDAAPGWSRAGPVYLQTQSLRL